MTREESTGSQEDKVLPMKATPLTPRTVHFDFDRSTIHPHITLDELSDDEFFSVWVTDDEFAASKKDYLAIVRKMMKDADFVETEDCCPRGLEFKTKEGARRRKLTKQRACFAVLEEQDIQKDEGFMDDQFISDVYAEFASQSSLEALHRGLKDEKTMFESLDEVDLAILEKYGNRKRNSRWSKPTKMRTNSPVSILDIDDCMEAVRSDIP